MYYIRLLFTFNALYYIIIYLSIYLSVYLSIYLSGARELENEREIAQYFKAAVAAAEEAIDWC